MARLRVACFLYWLVMLEISATKSERNIHNLPYWIQDSLLEYADEIGNRSLTGQIHKIYRKDLDKNYAAYYEFEFEDWFIVFSAGPKTGDHRLVEEGKIPRPTDILNEQAAEINQTCHKYFRLSADGTTICENDKGNAVASTINWNTLTTDVNVTTLPQDIADSMNDFKEDWEELAKKIRSSNEWKETSINSLSKISPTDNKITTYKVLYPGESAQHIPIGTSDVSKVKIQVRLEKRLSDSTNVSTLCLLLGNICSEEGRVDTFTLIHKKNNLANLNYIEFDVTDDYESFAKQFKTKSIDFYFAIIVADKFVVIRRYTITFSLLRDKRSSWSGFIEHTIPYENLMPDYNQHICCGGCYSGCVPVAWAQVFAYYDRVAHTYGFRYSIRNWSGPNGKSGDPLLKAPSYLNDNVKKYVEALRVPLGTRCVGTGGSTKNSATANVDQWFRQRQGCGKVITLSNIYQQVGSYVKQQYPVVNNFLYNKKSKSGHSVVVTKIRERSRWYKTCKQVGWWLGKKTKCEWKKEYEQQWYRRMGWGGSQNNWYPASGYGAFVAVI